MPNKLMVNLELVNVYELESDDSFDYEALPEKEQKVIDEQNDAFDNGVLQQYLMGKAMPCQCMTRELQERAMRRAAILSQGPGPMSVQLDITQVELDQTDFVVIINTERGIHKDIRFAVSHCRRCGAMFFWGDLNPIGDLIAHAFVDHDTTQQRKNKRAAQLQKLIDEGPKPPDGQPQFILENTETGEITPADDLINAMVNGGPMPDGMFTEEIKTPEPNAEPVQGETRIITGDGITAIPDSEKPSLYIPD